jgi:hypothetical protein
MALPSRAGLPHKYHGADGRFSKILRMIAQISGAVSSGSTRAGFNGKDTTDETSEQPSGKAMFDGRDSEQRRSPVLQIANERQKDYSECRVSAFSSDTFVRRSLGGQTCWVNVAFW